MNLYYWILNGKRKYIAGTVSLAGTEFYVNYKDVDTSNNLIEVEWQPGGAILQKTKNLNFENYYPWTGKHIQKIYFILTF